MLIIIFIASLIFFVSMGVKSKIPRITNIISIVVFALSVISTVVCFILTCITKEYYEEKTSEIPIITLQDNSFVEGHGSRYHMLITTTGAYTYYYRTSNGGVMQNTISAENTVVYPEESCKDPRVIEYSTYCTPVIDEEMAKFLFFGRPCEKFAIYTRYEIYVDKDAIVEDFTLDGKL